MGSPLVGSGTGTSGLGSEAPPPLREELASTVGGRCDLFGRFETKNNLNRILLR